MNRMKNGNGVALRSPAPHADPPLPTDPLGWEILDESGFGARADALFGDMPDGVIIQREGRIVYANRQMSEMLGLDDPSSMIGMVALEFYPEDALPSVISRLQSAYFGKPSPVCEHPLVRADGATARSEVSCMLLRLAGHPMLIEIHRNPEE